MRVLISTFGTRGDIDPYAALADRLARAGHSAVLAAPEAYRTVVSPDVGFEPIATGMDEVMRAGMTELSGPRQAGALARQMWAAMRTSLDEQWAAAQRTEPTIIVSHPKALAGIHIAEKCGVPFVASLPLPFLTPTADFPIPFLSRPLPRPINRWTYQFNRFTAVAYGGMINAFRRRLLGLRRVSRLSDYLHAPDGTRVPVLYPFSRHVVPVPRDYPSSAHVTGYWFREPDPSWKPPADLVEFLAGDRPVIYVGFGSMGFGKNAADRGRMVVDAAREAGVRAVLARGWGAVAADSSADVAVIDQVPHDWLFPRVAGVVHHGGAGTTAASLRAGRPTLVCPVLGDQPFWGRRVHEIGAGPLPLPLRSANVRDLAERIAALVGTAEYAAGARTVADGIAQEDGAGRAIEVLERIEAGWVASSA